MERTLAGANVVVLADQFNPSVVSQLFLTREGVVEGEAEFRPGCLFSDQVSHVQTQDFSLLVVPPQLQFAAKVPSSTSAVLPRLNRLLNAIPHTPFQGAGVNISWMVAPEGEAFDRLSRRLFLMSNSPVHAAFDVDGARFGAYMSRDVEGFRCKLDIKPVHAKTPQNLRENERLHFQFNFHADLDPSGTPGSTSAIVRLGALLGSWDAFSRFAARVVEQVE